MNAWIRHAAAAVITGPLLAATLAASAHAALVDRGGSMVYDSTLDITWLADWNPSQTSGHDADGRMNWLDANDWANNLVHGGFDDWRLPIVRQPDAGCSEVSPGGVFGPQHFGYGCTMGELGHLFYVDLAALAGSPITAAGDAAALALFANIQLAPYWTRSEFEPTPVNAWYFHTIDGGQFTSDKGDEWAAVAVRQGDVRGSTVPEPGSLGLALMALCGAVGATRRSRS